MYPELFVTFLVTSTSLGCQQIMSSDFRGRIEFSHLVATGEITDAISATSFQMTLKCILKDSGTQPAATINITHTSNRLDGRCFVNHFQKGKSYVVFLRFNAPSYQPQSGEEDIAKLPEVLKVCGLGVVSKVPKGKDSTSLAFDCPDVEPRVCSTKAPTTTTTPQVLKHSPGFSKTKTPGLDPVKMHTTSTLLPTVTSQPDSTRDKHCNNPNYNNTASQRHRNMIWYLTWYIVLLLCRSAV